MQQAVGEVSRPDVQQAFWCRRPVCARRGVCSCYLSWSSKPMAHLVVATRRLTAVVGEAPLAEAIAFAAERLAELTASEQTAARYRQLWGRFGNFASANKIRTVGEVGRPLVESFVRARRPDGRRPKPKTERLRIASIRRLFQIFRQYGLATGDPTMDLVQPQGPAIVARSLTPDEIDHCRSASLNTMTSTRQPTVWALAEVGGTTSEIPAVLPENLDLGAQRIWLPGSTKTDPRWARLSPWAAAQISRRLAAIGDAVGPIAYDGKGSAASRQASTCVTLRRILNRAGLAGDPSVRPASIRAWLGRQVLSESGAIDEVARRLGLRSLDQAAALVGWDWRGQDV
jgi:integrase